MNLVDDPVLLTLPLPETFELPAPAPRPPAYRPGRIGEVVDVDAESMLWAPIPG